MIGRRSLFTLSAALVATSGAGVLGARAAHVQNSPPLTVTPYKISGIYRAGERAGWKITAPPGKYKFRLRQNNQFDLQSGVLDIGTEGATIESTLSESAMLYLELTPPGGTTLTYGAAVEPYRFRPALPRPKDFDAFWKRKIEALHRVPENAVLTPGDGGRADVDYSTIRMDHVNGAHVYGQIAKPRKPGKYPAILILQWAGPPYPLQKNWVTDRAAEGWLALNIEPHDVLPTEPPSYYQALPDPLKNYGAVGQDDRERSAFVEMYLRDYRAADYLAHRPDWDGKTLVVTGGSMGGQQSLAVAGLHPKITHLIVEEPAGCDLNGSLAGRQEGYPFFPNTPKVRATAQYVDAVNFASRIRATSLVAMGFTDTIAPPSGIWVAYNQIRGRKEAAPMRDAPHNNTATYQEQKPYYDRSSDWLKALVKGQPIPAPELSGISANRPSPRTDANSLIAHRQLLEKARKGGIDLYFLGDSITRRWGTTDTQYRDFLANWNANFFGWNAANFGWGADTTQNILWRLENGELDGVNPKAIVLLAGTNNIGSQSGDEAKVRDVTAGLRAIIDTCRKKAPKATIIVTAIFPRSDNPATYPVIEGVNQNLQKLADGKRIRFLNLNGKLADSEGRLYPGMTVDGIHPTLSAYQIWADGLKPILTEVLGPPAKTDHAPPPTGDPSAVRPN